MKRRKPIDEQGHEPAHTLGGKARECLKCHDVRLRGQDWRRPCPPSAADAHEGKYRGG